MEAPKTKIKARMPPRQIPPAQVQALIAEMRASGAYPDLGGAGIEAPVVGQRRRGVAPIIGWVLAGAVAGAIVGYVAPVSRDLITPTPKAPAPTFMAVTDPKSADPPAPPPSAATPVVTALAPALRPAEAIPEPVAKPKSCLAGGPCTKTDVAAAERRLSAAYTSARKAGVSQANLSAARSKWNTAKARSAGRPRSTIGAYRSIAADLNAKTTKARKPRRR